MKGKGGLGFRDLEKFNEALLVKQLWRILTNPDLLVSKIMKEKYLAKPQNWERETPRAASWTWKSIFGTRNLVTRGIGKRVGNGKTIDIWQDNWIQGTEDGRIKTRRDPRCTLRKVDELIADGV